MTHASPSEAARAFLKTVWDSDAPTQAELIAALDRLLVAYDDSSDTGWFVPNKDPPDLDFKSLYGQTAGRFPELGFYSIADPLDMSSFAAAVGDAIDDIADITSDMRNTIWYADNFGEDCACWCFRSFYFHWGTHARELLLLLHAREIHSNCASD